MRESSALAPRTGRIQAASAMPVPSRLRDPRLLTVSAAPRFLWHSGVVGWQGAMFTELLTAPAGVVDHVHEHYCLRRTHAAYQRRKRGQISWESVPVGWSLRQPGEGQHSEWKGGGRRQFLFLSKARIEEVMEGRPPNAQGFRRAEMTLVVERLFDAMATDLATGSPAGPLVGDCLVTALCASLFGSPSAAPKTGGLQRAARVRVLERIEHDLHRSLALSDLASEAGLSVRQFCRAFRASTGMSPYQYVLRERVARAQNLIAAGRPLVEIALLCGFADQSQLTRVFTRHVGLSPAAYRRIRLH
jgi:AraC family transcriptional regulator